MPRRKVRISIVKIKCPICGRGFKDIYRHVAMAENGVLGRKGPHQHWHIQHGLPSGYVTSSDVEKMVSRMKAMFPTVEELLFSLTGISKGVSHRTSF